MTLGNEPRSNIMMGPCGIPEEKVKKTRTGRTHKDEFMHGNC